MTTHANPRTVDVHALPVMLTGLRLPSFHRHWPALVERADKEGFWSRSRKKAGGWPAARFLATLAELELAERETRRIRRHLIESHLPGGKTLATFDFKALPGVPRARVEALAAGDWIETGANLIAIGNSGAGKTHVLCAIGHALVEAGRRVLYARTTDLVQKLQAARRDLALEAALAKLDRFDLIILDDISYARKDQAETSVLFELIARRYETRSLAIAANQPCRAFYAFFRSTGAKDRFATGFEALQRLGQRVPRPGRHRRRHRQARPPRDHPGDEQRQLSSSRRRRSRHAKG